MTEGEGQAMTIRLGDLVGRLGGRLEGDPGIVVSGIAPLEHAGDRHITFLSSAKWRDKAAATGAAALILSPADDAVVGATYRGARIVTDNPYAYFARTAQWFEALAAQPAPPGVHPSAVVDASARVAPGASIGPLAVVEAGAEVADGAVISAGCFVGRDARIGAGTVLHPQVVVQARCIVGDRCILHSGVVVGAAGFGFANEKGA
ncbi:MAG: LpxD N-terminal domain-containing protein, partial [Burkholderiaceae bacterium]